MGYPRFNRTGNPYLDRNNRDLAQSLVTATVRAVITDAQGEVIKTIPHRLNRKPSYWWVVQAKPAPGVLGEVKQASNWASRDSITLIFPGNGEWEIEIQ